MASLVEEYLNNTNRNSPIVNKLKDNQSFNDWLRANGAGEDFFSKTPIEQNKILAKFDFNNYANNFGYNAEDEKIMSPNNPDFIRTNPITTDNANLNSQNKLNLNVNSAFNYQALDPLYSSSSSAPIVKNNGINFGSTDINSEEEALLSPNGTNTTTTNYNTIDYGAKPEEQKINSPINSDGQLVDKNGNRIYDPTAFFQGLQDNYNNIGINGSSRKLYDFGYNVRNLGAIANNKNLTEEERSSAKTRSILGMAVSGLGFGLEGAKELFNGIGDANMNDIAMTGYNDKLRKNWVAPTGDIKQTTRDKYMRYTNFFEDGGEMKFDQDALAVANDRALVNSGNGNATVEQGEYVDTGDGIKEALGEKHKDGGVSVDLEGGARVLTDMTEIGKEKSKALEKTFKIKLKPKDTFSDVMDKMNKKIGYTDIVDKQEKLIEKLAENDSLKDENTKNINNKLIGIRLNDLEQRRVEVENTQKFIYDTLYAMQELDKLKDKKGNLVKVKVPETALSLEKENGAEREFAVGGEMPMDAPAPQEQTQPELNDEQVAQILSQYIQTLPKEEQPKFIEQFKSSTEEEQMSFISELLKQIQ